MEKKVIVWPLYGKNSRTYGEKKNTSLYYSCFLFLSMNSKNCLIKLLSIISGYFSNGDIACKKIKCLRF